MSQEHIEQALAQYQPTDAAISEMLNRYAVLEVTGLDDRAGLEAVHEARMEVRGIRVQVEKKRKELKKDALEYGRQVDGEAKRITALLLAIEEPLAEKESIVAKEKERLAAIAAEKRKAALQVRLDAMSKFGVVLGVAVNPLEVQGWTDEEYEAQLAHLAQAHGDHVEEQERRKADEAIAAQELAEEREKLRVEREAMQAQQRAADEKAAAEHAKLQAEQVEIEARKQRLREQEDELVLAQRIREAKEQAVIDARVREREEQAAREAEEAELERLRPQYEKIHRYVNHLMDLRLPDVDRRSTIAAIIGEAACKIRALAPTVKAEEVPE